MEVASPWDEEYVANDNGVLQPTPAQLHHLSREFELSETEVLDIIAAAPRLRMAVRGWVAEHHLIRTLKALPGVGDENVKALEVDGHADAVLHHGGRDWRIECKNVLRTRYADGSPKLDFQRTRASKADPCSRYYSPSDFAVVAACLHAVDEEWSFRYRLTSRMAPHRKCPGRLDHRIRIDHLWTSDVLGMLRS